MNLNYIKNILNYSTEKIIKIYKISSKFYKKFGEIGEEKYKINWEKISELEDLDENFLEKYKYCLNWEKLIIKKPLSDNFINENYLFIIEMKNRRKCILSHYCITFLAMNEQNFPLECTDEKIESVSKYNCLVNFYENNINKMTNKNEIFKILGYFSEKCECKKLREHYEKNKTFEVEDLKKIKSNLYYIFEDIIVEKIGLNNINLELGKYFKTKDVCLYLYKKYGKEYIKEVYNKEKLFEYLLEEDDKIATKYPQFCGDFIIKNNEKIFKNKEEYYEFIIKNKIKISQKTAKELLKKDKKMIELKPEMFGEIFKYVIDNKEEIFDFNCENKIYKFMSEIDSYDCKYSNDGFIEFKYLKFIPKKSIKEIFNIDYTDVCWYDIDFELFEILIESNRLFLLKLWEIPSTPNKNFEKIIEKYGLEIYEKIKRIQHTSPNRNDDDKYNEYKRKVEKYLEEIQLYKYLPEKYMKDMKGKLNEKTLKLKQKKLKKE